MGIHRGYLPRLLFEHLNGIVSVKMCAANLRDNMYDVLLWLYSVLQQYTYSTM
jgi:hypothetical protein